MQIHHIIGCQSKSMLIAQLYCLSLNILPQKCGFIDSSDNNGAKILPSPNQLYKYSTVDMPPLYTKLYITQPFEDEFGITNAVTSCLLHKLFFTT